MRSTFCLLYTSESAVAAKRTKPVPPCLQTPPPCEIRPERARANNPGSNPPDQKRPAERGGMFPTGDMVPFLPGARQNPPHPIHKPYRLFAQSHREAGRHGRIYPPSQSSVCSPSKAILPIWINNAANSAFSLAFFIQTTGETPGFLLLFPVIKQHGTVRRQAGFIKAPLNL